MEQKLSTTLMSHLCDIQEEAVLTYDAAPRNIRHRASFLKFLILKYSSRIYNLDTDHDPDEDYKEFTTKHPTL